MRKILANPLFGGSAVMILGSNLANFFAYIYHFVLGRMLGKDLYGELVAFISLIALLSASYSFLNLVIVKFVSAADKKEKEKLFSWFFHNTLKVGVIASVIILIFTPVFQNLLHMRMEILLFVAPIFLVGLISFVYRSFLQGLLRFSKHIIVTNIEFIGRLVFGVILVLLGFGVLGAVGGILISSVVGLFFGRRYLKSFHLLKRDILFKPDKKIRKYAIVILINTIATTSFFSTDILLVKHFFLAGDAGIYAATSTLGKTILFATLPISSVMFPIISSRHAKGQKYLKVFFTSLLMMLGVAGLVLIGFLVLPQLAVTILYGQDFLQAANYLFIYGVFITIFSINTLFLSYFLSIEKNKVVFISASAAIIQIMGIVRFHDSLDSIIMVCIVTSILMLLGLLLYFGHEVKSLPKK